jgi:anti-sigma factor RsiW
MRNHLSDGALRAGLDEELTAEQRQHLERCLECQARQRSLQAEYEKIARRLAFLAPADEPVPPARTVWAELSQRLSIKKETSMFKKWFTFPVVRFATAALVIIALILAFPGTRALAGELLNLFRVQQVAVVQVDFTGLEQLTGDGALGNQFTELISNSMNITDEPGDPVEAADAAQASQLAGFDVRLPESDAPSQIYVMDGAAFSMTVDRAKAQALLEEAGRGDLVLPESVDGADISVTIPASVSAAYGTCPKPETDTSENEEAERRYPDCVILAQIPSPSVSAPADLDIDQLARIGLEFTGMSAEEAAAFTSTVDWTSTLVVPIPSNAADYTQITVDGVTGTLIHRPSREGEPTTFALLWVKDGIIYAISGRGTNSEKAVEMANSMP